uniref:Uncharacterized protein n=1 Tax=Solanum lycopersicum TaxID=4081 RepID=A0A3Q7HKM0_SOLLC
MGPCLFQFYPHLFLSISALVSFYKCCPLNHS